MIKLSSNIKMYDQWKKKLFKKHLILIQMQWIELIMFQEKMFTKIKDKKKISPTCYN